VVLRETDFTAFSSLLMAACGVTLVRIWPWSMLYSVLYTIASRMPDPPERTIASQTSPAR